MRVSVQLLIGEYGQSPTSYPSCILVDYLLDPFTLNMDLLCHNLPTTVNNIYSPPPIKYNGRVHDTRDEFETGPAGPGGACTYCPDCEIFRLAMHRHNNYNCRCGACLDYESRVDKDEMTDEEWEGETPPEEDWTG